MHGSGHDAPLSSVPLDPSDLPTAHALGLAEIVHLSACASTMDVAHERASAGAPAGVLVIADQQLAGRGRGGNAWASDEHAGLWITLIERPKDQHAVRVLALRLGLALAEVLSPFVDAPIMLKWPNDVFVRAGKLAGILVEARWRDAEIEWVAIGIGINRVTPADVPHAASLRAGISREAILLAVVPAIRRATALVGHLSDDERARWDARDLARGRQLLQPREGVAEGINPDGALRVRRAATAEPELVHTGSLVFAE